MTLINLQKNAKGAQTILLYVKCKEYNFLVAKNTKIKTTKSGLNLKEDSIQEDGKTTLSQMLKLFHSV